MATLETILNLLPLNIYIKGKVRIEAHKLKCARNWRTRNTLGYFRVTDEIKIPIFEMSSDTKISKLFLEKSFIVNLDWIE